MGREGSTPKGKGDGEKGKGKTALFACLEEEGMGPWKTEMPDNEVNYAVRRINLSNVMWGDDWGRKNRAKGCSSIIATCLNG